MSCDDVSELQGKVDRLSDRIAGLEAQLRDLMLVTLQPDRRFDVMTDPQFPAALAAAREEHEAEFEYRVALLCAFHDFVDHCDACARRAAASNCLVAVRRRLAAIAAQYAERCPDRGAADTLLAFVRQQAALEAVVGIETAEGKP
jgi:hypothetical protein